MTLSIDQFLDQLTSSGLLSANDVTSALASLPNEQRPQDGEQLARELVRQKKLTKFQAEQICLGKGSSLTLGNYVILDKLGQGGMGVVLKAEHKRLKRPVALKVMSAAAVKSAEAVQRFHREVEVAAKLRHPNVVATDDADEAKGTHFLVMEYVEGSDLSALVKKHGPMPTEKAMRCIIQAARGLEYAHEQGIVHRDIKPANLLIDAKGTVKILDMGLARIDDSVGGSSEGAGLTSTGTIIGTVDYMSPEQAMDTKQADARSDIYSLGCSLYYLLTGRSLYDGDTMMKKLMAHRDLPVPELSAESRTQNKAELSVTLDSQLSALDSVFRRMVAKRPEDRPQSMSEVIAELERCLVGGSPTVAFERLSSPLVNSVTSVLNADGAELGLTQPETIALPPRVVSPAAQTETIVSAMMGGAETDPRTVQTMWLDQTGLPHGDKSANGAKRLLGVAAVVVLCVVVAMIVVTQSNKPLPLNNTTTTTSTNSRSLSPATVDSGNGKSDKVPAGESPLVVMEVPPQNEFSSPEEIAEIGIELFGPKIAANGLSLWFHAPEDKAAGNGRLILWQAWRHAKNEPFHKPIPAEESLNNQPDHNLSDVTLSADELVLSFCRTNIEAGSHSDLWLSTRPSGDASWSAPVSAGAGVNSDHGEWEPELSPNGLELFFHSQRPNENGGTDLWVSRRASREADFGPAENLGPEINSTDNEGGAALSGDGLTLMFHRFTPKEIGVWRATRKSLDTPFEVPHRVRIPLPADKEFFSVSLSGSSEELYGTYRSKGRSVVGLSRLKPSAAVAAKKNFVIRVSPGVHVEMPSLKLDPATPHTMEAWVTPASRVQDDKHVFGWPGPSSLFVRRDDSSWTFGLTHNDRFQFVPDPQPITPGRRAHVATVRTGKEMRLFVDGQRVASQPEPAMPLKDQSKPFSLSVGFSKAEFSGDYDEVRVSSVARYDDNFAPQTRLEPDAETLALYHCDENGGSQLVDASGNKHHGKIIGKATWHEVGKAAANADAPKPAIAPFDAKQARVHQEAWAKHLGTTVETTNSVGAKMVLIPPGEFMMGSTDEQVAAALKAADELKADERTKDSTPKNERPQHKVVITKPLLMSATEVTIGQFKKFAAATGYQTEAEQAVIAAKAAPPPVEAGKPAPMPIQTYLNPGQVARDDLPAAFITWNDAVAYCQWLSSQEKAAYRLPTEAEWEYACRAGTTTQYSFGDDVALLNQYGWSRENSGYKSHPVGTKQPNGFGLFDMHGSLSEWCGDYFDEKWYGKSSSNDPSGPSVGSTRVIRGGQWSWYGSVSCRSAYRNDTSPKSRNHYNGFRCVREFAPPVPPAAKAPFDTKQARAHQEAWAKHLGTTVETTNAVGAKMVLIPPGEFLMGAPDSDADAQPYEKPQHRVRLTKPLYLGATEVTVGQFRRFVEATKYVTQAESDSQGAFEINPKVRRPHYTWNNPQIGESGDESPVRCVSWEDARRFCEWLSQTEGRVYRLPTEAEWEYACRAGTTTRYSFGNDFTDTPSPPRIGGVQLRPVAQLPANPFGLFDMHGNVNEICRDSGRTFAADAVTDPLGSLEMNVPAVVKGGAVSSSAARLRSSNRYLNDARQFPESNFATLVKGFRIVAEFGPPAVTSTKRTFASDEWIDVMPLLKPELDKVDIGRSLVGKNDWRIEQGELRYFGDDKSGKLYFPVRCLGRSFEWEFEFNRTAGNISFNTDIPIPGGFVPLTIGNDKIGFVNESLTDKFQIVNDQRTKLRLRVTQAGAEDRLEVFVNDQSLVDWKGQLAKHKIEPPQTDPRNPSEHLSLFAHGRSNYVFRAIHMQMLNGGSAELLRSANESTSK